MIQVTSREFRDKQADFFNLADAGEQVVIRRRGKSSYMLTPVLDSDFIVTPELEERLEEGRRQYREGKTVSFKNAKEVAKFLEDL